MNLFSKIFGDLSSQFIKKQNILIAEINTLEKSISILTDTDFPSKTLEFKERFKKGEFKNWMDLEL